MAWTEKYAGGYRGRYKDRYGRNRTAGSHKKKSDALKMAQREELKIADGIWVDPDHGKVTLDDYFHNLWLPNVMLEEQTKISYETWRPPTQTCQQIRRTGPPARSVPRATRASGIATHA